MVLGLSHSLEIFSKDGIKVVSNQLAPGAILWVVLSVQEPLWDVVLDWSGDDVRDLGDLVLGDLSASQAAVDLSNLESEDGKSSTDTTDLSETEWGLLFTVDICVLNSKNMLKFVWVLYDQCSHLSSSKNDIVN